jgi:Ca2+-binding RTX toxin-like protein
MTSGTGNDTYVVDAAGDVVNETSTTTTEIDTVQAGITYTLGSNLENLTLTGNSAINGTGNSLNNSLTGNSANNILNGSTGNDTLTGGTGNDTYILDSTSDVISETSTTTTEIDSVSSSVTYTLGNNLENLTLTGTAAINGTGNSLNNSLTGNSAANTINGGAGNDIMTGGTGNDTYIVNAAGDVINENSTTATEIDTVSSSATYTLGSNLENLTLTDSSAISATGNSLDNSLTGNTANNTLNGSTGNDTMTGGTGNDTYVVDAAGDVVNETSTTTTEIDTVQAGITYTLGSNLENLTLTGTSAINGTGNSLNNSLTGNTANNTLNGSTGNDTMTGGTGNDTYVVDAAGDVVNETSTTTTEIDTVQAGITYTLGSNLENLTLTGTSAINGTGNSLNNSLTGNTANNTLNGSTGNDTMTGGTGNDTYVVDAAGDVVNETSTTTTEIDTVQAGITYTLGSNLENLTLTGSSAINGTGNSLNNSLTGNSAANTLNGGAGNDTLIGGTGNDTYTVDSSGDDISETNTTATEIDRVNSSVSWILDSNLENLTLTGTNAINGTGNSLDNSLTGNSANNSLSGGDGDDTLTGSGGNDSLVGGLGNDTLIGGAGNDTLTGSAGNDQFLYDTNAAFTTSAVGSDRITDFTKNSDKIVLDKTTFTVLTSVAGNGFSVASEFGVVTNDTAVATASAFIVYSSGSGNLFYNQNGAATGLGTGAQFDTLASIPALAAGDFIIRA